MRGSTTALLDDVPPERDSPSAPALFHPYLGGGWVALAFILFALVQIGTLVFVRRIDRALRERANEANLERKKS